MPQINRIRVNNVKYNFGTQYYDDFLMRFSCKNTIYDLANGGGKSVLMLLLLQNLIPNCTLDEKQPIEKLFRTSEGSSTIHSLIEWKLSDIHIKDNYKYMLTGFCARKGNDENVAVEYFNYVIFYREFNDNDIKNLPLSNGKERITYNGLKNYLRELSKNDLSLKVKIFERKGEYQRFIADYGLYESEWEIIRGINKTEGHVRTYFETNYKTTRKVVEDLLIEEIIQKSFINKTGMEDGGDTMTRTLLDIKDKLMDLSQKKDDIENYNRQIEVIDGFEGRVSDIRKMFFGRDSLVQDIKSTYSYLNTAMKNNESENERLLLRKEIILKEKTETEAKIDCAKVSRDKAEACELDRELSDIKEAVKKGEEEIKGLESDLVIRECVNDYQDYVYYKNQADTMRETLNSLLKDKGELSEEIEKLVSVLYEENRKTSEGIEGIIEKEEQEILAEESKVRDKDTEIEQAKNQMAVCTYVAEDCRQNMEKSDVHMAEIRKSLNNYSVADIGNEIKKCSLKLEQMIKDTGELEDNIAIASLRENEAELQLHDILAWKDRIREEYSEALERKLKLDEINKKIERLKEIYVEKDIHLLLETVEEKYSRVNNRISEITSIIADNQESVRNLKAGCPVGISRQAAEVIEYINRYHNNAAVSGINFIQELEDDKKQEILSRYPYLPYCVIIKDDFENIAEDMAIKELNLKDYAVPVIPLADIKEGKDRILTENGFFVMKREEMFIDRNLMEQEAEKLLYDNSKLLEEKKAAEDIKESAAEDMDFIKLYIGRYMEEYESIKGQTDDLRLMLGEADDKERSKREELQSVKEGKKELENSLLKIKNTVTAFEETICKLKELERLNNEYDVYSARIAQADNRKNSLKRHIRDLEAENQAVCNRIKVRRDKILNLKAQIKQMEDEWNNNYRPYYHENDRMDFKENPYSAANREEIITKLNGLIGAFTAGLSDVNDKKKLAENYELAMEKSLQAIDYKGVSVDYIKELFKERKYVQTSKEQLVYMKNIIGQKKKEHKELLDTYADLKSRRDKIAGAVEHGIRSVKDKYGSYSQVDLNGQTYEKYIVNMEIKLSACSKDELDADFSIESLSKEAGHLSMMLRDVEKVMDKYGIFADGADISVAVEDIEKLSEMTDKSVKAFEEYNSRMVDRKLEFDQEKNMLISMLNKLKSERLAEQMEENIIMPVNAEEAEEISESLKEISRCLKLEMDRVEKSIGDMEKIKDSFENQCIQTCINIKTELDRLPKQSKINLDGENISIISLTIPYVREDMYKSRMSAYIDETINTADKMNQESERVKYIRNRLSWKRLFSVIVTDMNGIKLNLYKRERIKQQSRYLRYEEAVGSTGQSQGIYIQFLIAIINYISAINSKDKDARLGKVIFIDNPFGAAKDIYIWEPIFKLLKTNNVQLIVPARGVTPAITARFDVNYILGQKLINGRQQTVVTDYSSHVDCEEMDYSKLEFEQTTLF